jgi:hypothetical protein
MTDLLVPDPSRGCRRWQVGVLATVLGIALGLLWWFDPAKSPVPLCGFHALTGLYCPGCGTLRATHELLHGRPFSALRDNALWTLSLPLLLYLGVSELQAAAGHRPFPGDVTHKPWFWISVAIVATIFFVLRNTPWGPLMWLAPAG